MKTINELKPAVVELTEEEIMTAICMYLECKGWRRPISLNGDQKPMREHIALMDGGAGETVARCQVVPAPRAVGVMLGVKR